MMRFELQVHDESDRATLLHLLICEQHQEELINKLIDLMEAAAHPVPPFRVWLEVDDLGTTLGSDGDHG